MIRVIIELDKYGLGVIKKTIGKAKIINDGTGTIAKGNYRIELIDRDIKGIKTIVKDFDRLNKGVWDLLYLALKNIYEKRN